MSLFKRFILRFKRTKTIFFTHTPGDWCKLGSIHERDGVEWVVTGWVQESPTLLHNGGRAVCFNIVGKKL
jgi:hypothetical protein